MIDSLPVGAALVPLSMIWGVLWTQAGYPPIWGLLFSATIYAGAVQYLALALLVSGASPLSCVIAAVPIAVRNSFYTMTASEHLPKKWPLRLYLAYTLVDPNFGIVMSKPKEVGQNPWFQMTLTLCIQLYWICGTALGIFNVFRIPDGFNALSFSFPALLIVLIYEQVKKEKSIKPFILALATGIPCYLFAGNQWLLIALVIATTFTIVQSKWRVAT